MQLIAYSFVTFLAFGVFTACKKETRQPVKPGAGTEIDGKWSLISSYGGISGIHETHDEEEINWNYLPSGLDNFQQINRYGTSYLVVDANELGQMTFSGNQLLINQNTSSTGEGACGFYMTLQRQ